MKKKILIIIASLSLFLSLILIGYVLVSSISENKSFNNSTSTSTEVITTISDDNHEYLLYPEKNEYLLSDTQINLIIRRKDGNEFTYSQRYKLYRKINNEWVIVPTKDKSNTFKPLAYRAIKTDKFDYARGFVRVYLDDFDYQFEPGEYKVELIFWEDDLSTIFNIVN